MRTASCNASRKPRGARRNNNKQTGPFEKTQKGRFYFSRLFIPEFFRFFQSFMEKAVIRFLQRLSLFAGKVAVILFVALLRVGEELGDFVAIVLPRMVEMLHAVDIFEGGFGA